MNIDYRERLIFALDLPTIKEARNIVQLLGDQVRVLKLGMELSMNAGYWDFVEELLVDDYKVFVDLKLFDIPETVGRAIKVMSERGVTFTTVHGNDKVMEVAAANKGDTLKVLAVTALTSLDQGDLTDLGFDCNVEELVLSRAKRALELGCDGVISSGLEVAALRQHIDNKLTVVVPGIRPVSNDDDQKRISTVSSVFAAGADYIVVGRPIRDSQDPYSAAKNINSQIDLATMRRYNVD